MRSETTKYMGNDDLDALQNKISQFSSEELKEYIRSFDPDQMGFFGQEGIDEYKQESDEC